MLYSSPKQLGFPPVAGHTVRGDCEGGALSSDFGPLLLRGVDRQMAARSALRRPSVTSAIHPLSPIPCMTSWPSASPKSPQAMLTAMMPTACAVTPGAHWVEIGSPWRQSPMWPVLPRSPRREHSRDRTDLYRLTRAFVDHCIASP